MTHQITFRKIFCSLTACFFCFAQVANSQGHEPTILAPIELSQPTQTIPSLTPVDITPVNMSREQQLLRPGFTYYLFQNLPSRLWFNVSAEASQRYESNIFFSRTSYVSDYVFRILPNVTLGYELFKKISVYSNYFVIKDIFAGQKDLSFPTTQSLSLGFRRDFTVTPLTNLQLDFQSRELWQTAGLRQADLIPGLTLTRFLSPRAIIYANLLLQMRGGDYFVAPTREIDPFYTIGALYTKGAWMLSAVGTLVTNFRHPPFNTAIPNQSNNSIICDIELSHPIPKMPYLVGFARAEPIWNWNGNGVPGLSGFDFRFFTGVRMTLAKPTYNASINKLKQQLKELNVNQIDESSGIPEPPPKEELPKPHSELPIEPKDIAPPQEQKAQPAKPLLDSPVEFKDLDDSQKDKTKSFRLPFETPIAFKDLDDLQKDTPKSSKLLFVTPIEFKNLVESQTDTAQSFKLISETPVEFKDLDDSQKDTAKSFKLLSEAPLEFKDLDDSQKDQIKSAKPMPEVPLEFKDLDDSQKDTAELLKPLKTILAAHTSAENPKYKDLDSFSKDN